MAQTETPVFPRRAYVAGGLSAILAAGALSLSMLGGLSSVAADTFQFSRGVAFAAGEEGRLKGIFAQALPDERVHVTILAHSGSAGDEAANLALSEDRAALAAQMAIDLGIPADRITAQGVGGASPLQKQDGEAERTYQSRLARVDVSLQMRR